MDIPRLFTKARVRVAIFRLVLAKSAGRDIALSAVQPGIGELA
jgi:hypothetical protein